MINLSPVRISNYPKIDYTKAVKQTPKFINNLQCDTVCFTGINTQDTKQKIVDECKKKAEEKIGIFNTIFGSAEEFQKEFCRVKELAEQNKIDGKFHDFRNDEYEFTPFFRRTVMTCTPVDMPKQKGNLEYLYSFTLNDKSDRASCIVSCNKTGSEGNDDSQMIFYYVKDGHLDKINYLNETEYAAMDFDEKGNLLRHTNYDTSEVTDCR